MRILKIAFGKIAVGFVFSLAVFGFGMAWSTNASAEGNMLRASAETSRSHPSARDHATVSAEVAQPTAVSSREIGPEQRTEVIEHYGKLPLSFIENNGQIDKRISYYTQSSGRALAFTQKGITLHLTQGKPDVGAMDASAIQKPALAVGAKHVAPASPLQKAHTIQIEFVNARTAKIEGRERASGIVSYFKGPKNQWKTGIPTYAQVSYSEPWPGIDLVYDGDGGKLEAIYRVAPHADPAKIRLRYLGQESLRIDDTGNLVYQTSVGEVKESAPVLYQEIDGKRIDIKGAFALLDKQTVGFTVAAYNPNHTLIIDPVLVYAGYIGGGGDEWGNGIAVDSAGNAYVTGYTCSVDFPTTVGSMDTVFNGDYCNDAFVVKVNASGTGLVYAGYIGGSGDDRSNGIAVDSVGNAYVTGYTNSADFPTTVGPDLTYNSANSYYTDAFVAKVNALGTGLLYAGYIGGSEYDYGNGIAVDSAGFAYITGHTSSTGFPTVVGSMDTTFNGYYDAFVAKVNALGTALVYAGYLGGSGDERGNGIAVDSAGNAYVTGYTTFTDFPVTVGPDLTYNENPGGYSDVFVAKVNASGTGLAYAGYIGGSSLDVGNGIAVDSAGNAYVTGYTGSTNFPVIVGLDLTFNGDSFDAFVAKVNASGTGLVYAGYLGGSANDYGWGITVDSAGNAYVTGYTASTNFPVTVGPDLTQNGANGNNPASSDVFVAKVNASGTGLVYAGFIGGSTEDWGTGIAVDSAGNAYVTGYTGSTETTFPVIVGPDITFNDDINGYLDTFVAKVSAEPTPTSTFTLTVTKAGTGTGTVTSAPVGINCGTDCTEAYTSGVVVTLTATPAAGSLFSGWSGACTGTGSCVVTMNAATTVTAVFIVTVPYSWITASTATGLTSDDQALPFSLPFAFTFYGTTYPVGTQIYISSNGFLSFASAGGTVYTPTALPNAATPNALVAGLWRDLYPPAGGCSGSNGACITYSSSATQFVVSYNNVRNYSGTDRQTFQIILNSNGTIVYQYALVTNTVSTTIGVENQTGTVGYRYQPLPTNNLAIRIY